MKIDVYLPGDDSETKALKKRFLKFSGIREPLFLGVFGLILWFLDLRFMAMAMWMFSAFSLSILTLFYIIRDHVKWFATIKLYFFVLFSFAAVLFFGGILHSGGVVFVGLAGALISLSFFKAKQFRIIFSVYILTVIIEALLQPYLTPQPEVTPKANLILFVMHILVISGVMFATISYYIEQNIQAKQKESDRLKEMDSLKTRFYTNISHEFRTPLTVIMGIADQIKENPDRWLFKGPGKITEQSQSLLYLVNQMMDLSKLEAGAMSVNLKQGDIVGYLKYLVESFQGIAESKHINLRFTAEKNEFYMDYDADKLMHIMTNLLSNALKFTPEDCDVLVSVGLGDSDETQNILRIMVKDTGIGIPADQLSCVFERFYQAEYNAGFNNRGSGLGLSLTRQLVNLLKGTISVQSDLGKGAEFTVELPISRTSPMAEDHGMSNIKPAFVKFPSDSKKVITTELVEDNQNDELPILLLVEDNRDVVEFLADILDSNFNVHVANNGKEGLEKALLFVPDIIVSDVMMPEMDGFELLENLKNGMSTSHIPVVLLTARANFESKIMGLEKGADAYLAKPFSTIELIAVLNNLMENRKKMQQKLAGYWVYKTPKRISSMKPELSFLQKLHEIVDANLQDENFDIQLLCNMIGMSRSQLYRKFKALTNQSLGKFIRSMRLENAKHLIEVLGLNVSEAAYASGFKNLSHFSYIFKEEFGYSPSENAPKI